jgi:tetratricopeptide (TPR) repeat protein
MTFAGRFCGREKAASLFVLSALWLLSGCATYVGDEFVRGRQALLRNQPRQALAYFQKVASQDPDYTYRSMNFSEGIWTYLGRTQYQLGRFEEARQSLQRALAQNPNDYMARLHLGLTEMRLGQYDRGLNNVVSAMRGLHEWIEYMERTQPMQAYWDPTRDIRGAIEKALAGIQTGTMDPEDLIATGEWVGKQMEEEIDRARRDERRRYEEDGDRQRVQGIQ